MALIARWRFEPGALTTDSSGNSNTLTIPGGAADPTIDSSWRVEGQASAKFVNASSQRAYIVEANQSAGFPGLSTDAVPVTTFSICGWFKTPTISVTSGILNKWSATAGNRCFQLWFGGATKKLTFCLRDTSGNESAVSGQHQTVLSDNSVYFFAVGFDETTDYLFVRLRDINANSIGTDVSAEARAAGWDGLNVSTVHFYVGTQNGSAVSMDGWLDDVRIYSGDYLTAAQITQICRQSSGLAGKRLMMGG